MYLELIKRLKPRMPVIILISAIITLYVLFPRLSGFLHEIRQTSPVASVKRPEVVTVDAVPETEAYKLAKLCMWGITIVGCVKLLSRRN